MSIDSINNAGVSNSNSATGSSSKAGNSNLTMDDFFKLMVAQLQHQDMYNSMDDSQFIAQMAQFSMVQAMSDLNELSQTSYGVSLIGKEVTIAKVGDDGKVNSFKGLVDSVNFYNGKTQVVVDDKNYDLSSVMSVKEPDIIIPDSNVKGSDPVKKSETESTNSSTNTSDSGTQSSNSASGSSNSETGSSGSASESTDSGSGSGSESTDSGSGGGV